MTENNGKLIGLLVGMHFRPPAVALVKNCHAGIPLFLQPEPENPYDSNAIRVMLDGADLRGTQELERDLLSQGFEMEEVMRNDSLWQLGYLAKTGGKPLAGKPWAGNVEVTQHLGPDVLPVCEMAFGPAGEPLVVIRFEEVPA